MRLTANGDHWSQPARWVAPDREAQVAREMAMAQELAQAVEIGDLAQQVRQQFREAHGRTGARPRTAF